MSYEEPLVFRYDDVPPHLGIDRLIGYDGTVWTRTGFDEWLAPGLRAQTFDEITNPQVRGPVVEFPSALNYQEALEAAWRREQAGRATSS